MLLVILSRRTRYPFILCSQNHVPDLWPQLTTAMFLIYDLQHPLILLPLWNTKNIHIWLWMRITDTTFGMMLNIFYPGWECLCNRCQILIIDKQGKEVLLSGERGRAVIWTDNANTCKGTKKYATCDRVYCVPDFSFLTMQKTCGWWWRRRGVINDDANDNDDNNDDVDGDDDDGGDHDGCYWAAIVESGKESSVTWSEYVSGGGAMVCLLSGWWSGDDGSRVRAPRIWHNAAPFAAISMVCPWLMPFSMVNMKSSWYR